MNSKSDLLMKKSTLELDSLILVWILFVIVVSNFRVAKTKPNVILVMADDMG